MKYQDIADYNLENKRILVRVDLNVPVHQGKIIDNTRIEKIIPTIKYLLEKKAKIILVSHFGRPKNGYEEKYSMKFIAEQIREMFALDIVFSEQIIGDEVVQISKKLNNNQILLLENIRFHSGESKNDYEFARELSKLADFYMNDAFSCSHRAHASISAIREFLPSFHGLLLREELDNLNKYLAKPLRPIIAIIGGSKVSTKLTLLKSLIKKVDYLVIGGSMANSFLKAKNFHIGNSFYEEDLLDEAKEILKSNKVILPTDVVVANEISDSAVSNIVDLKNFNSEEMILDIGPDSVARIIDLMNSSKTLIMNGPVGVFECVPFSHGTSAIIAQAAKLTDEKKLVSVAGGGDIVAAISKNGMFDSFSYISTAGGAFLEWLEGRKLPGI